MASPSHRFGHEGVEGLRTGRYNLGISSSCIVYRLGDTVIDTGPPNQWPVVRRFLQERNVEQVLVTHHHEDHGGNGARLQRELEATVFFPPSGVTLARDGFPLRAYQRVIWGTPKRFVPQAMPDEMSVGGGFRLRAVHAPGHSPDMTCYLEVERGWLFTGDLYITSKPLFFRADENMDEQIESLRRVVDLEFETVFCAHRGVVTEGRRAIRAKLDYLISLRDEIQHLHSEGRSVAEITRTLLGREKLTSLITLYHFSKRNLVRACLPAHAT
ncbi:MAG: MBL fold metallo-hydrolase [Gemmatimonadetes bacterium]|nr:MBL fold metallo-hydrolase [Gemmatimonadota bacterium]